MLVNNILTVDRRLLLVAPPLAFVPHCFRRISHDADRREDLVAELQRVRGAVYLADGYVRQHELLPGERHQTAEDARSWHLLMTDASGAVTACVWYLEHENTTSVRDLRIGHSPLAASEWREKFHGAVDGEIRRARRDGLHYAEVGGWAVSAHRRRTADGLLLSLAVYALARLLGGALGITTANVAHASSSILRRLGGSYLHVNGTPMPAYFDPRYNATVELLRFDSRQPSPTYRPLVDLLRVALSNVAVLVAEPTHAAETWTSQVGMANRYSAPSRHRSRVRASQLITAHS